MDYIYSHIPMGLLRYVLFGILIISLSYGYITGNDKKASKFYIDSVKTATQPLIDRFLSAAANAVGIKLPNLSN